MKYKKRLKFFEMVRNKSIDDHIVRTFTKAFEVNREIFNRNPGYFRIIICDTEKEFRKEAKYYYQKWATATVLRSCNLVTRSPDFLKKIGRWQAKVYQPLMNHEMNHVFWQSLYRITRPSWLAEGLACVIGKNFILDPEELKKMINDHKVDASILHYRYLKRNFDRGHIPQYPVWANFTQYITEEYSLNKIIDLMKRYFRKPTLTRYNRIFKQKFGMNQKQLFNKFMIELEDFKKKLA